MATDNAGARLRHVVVLEADIPDPLVLNGNDAVVQGDSAAYYYEFTLGSDYAWTYTGAQAQQVFNSFAISLQWDSLGMQQVCVTETNEDGCVGPEVCLDVWVEDDVAHVAMCLRPRRCWPTPTPCKRPSWCSASLQGRGKMQGVEQRGGRDETSLWEGGRDNPWT